MPMHKQQTLEKSELGNGNIACHDSLRFSEERELIRTQNFLLESMVSSKIKPAFLQHR